MNVFENIEKEIADIVKSKKPLLFKNKRRDAYNLPPDRLLHVYQNYFTDFPGTGNYTFKFSKNDENDLLFLFRVDVCVFDCGCGIGCLVVCCGLVVCC